MSTSALQEFIAHARWFGGKGRTWSLTGVRRLGELPDPPPGLRAVIDLAEITYAEGDVEYYQLPLSLRDERPDHLEHAHIGSWEVDGAHVHVHDAVHDRDAMGLWLAAFDAAAVADDSPTHAAERGRLSFQRLPGHDLDLATHSTLFSGEQSNSSVAFGEDSLMKVFRRLTPGVNPDIAVHQVLTESGSEHVAGLYGWLDLVDTADDGTDATMQLAMLQQFLRTATDGWDLALTSVRNLFVEADLHAEEVGGDFAAEAARLGTAVAEVHADLAAHFPTATLTGPEVSALADAMSARLDAALRDVPDLAPYEATVRAAFDDLRGVDRVEVQQVHGDLHLGQTLRTVKGWKIVDFEGEPAKPLAERLRPDSRWRDVAGMLRSFDYAPHVVSMTVHLAASDPEAAQQHYRAVEWSARNSGAFLQSYLGRAPDDTEAVLLTAYVLDKAVYEAVYEARNRPSWVGVPLDGIERWTA